MIDSADIVATERNLSALPAAGRQNTEAGAPWAKNWP